LAPLPAVDRPLATPKRSIIASPSLEGLDVRRASAKLLEQAGMSSYTRLTPTLAQFSSMPSLPKAADVGIS
jgi:hypothetical protein